MMTELQIALAVGMGLLVFWTLIAFTTGQWLAEAIKRKSTIGAVFMTFASLTFASLAVSQAKYNISLVAP